MHHCSALGIGFDQSVPYPFEHKLRDSVALLDCITWSVQLGWQITLYEDNFTPVVIVGMVEKQHLDLPSIVGINDTSPGVYEILHCETASRGYPTVLSSANISSAHSV